MKTYLLTLLIGIFGATQLVAQNWQPFKPGESFLYKHAATFPERTVRIDSVTTDGGDSIWHFNRLFVLLPSYFARIDGPNLGGRSLRILGNGQYLFTDSTRIFLNTWAHLGDTCLRDSLQPNHVGIVARIAQDFVLGEVDSIKVIVIAPDTMVISKNHGIVKWPGILGGTSFSLVGIQERHLGDTLPGFDGFFQFRVGDEYYWRASWGGMMAEQAMVMNFKQKYRSLMCNAIA